MNTPIDIEDIYSLTPMQAGMLYHTLSAPESGVYFQQMSCRLEGELDAAAFRQAWTAVMARHAVLRTAVVWEGLDEPQQVVYPTLALPLEEMDWRGLPAAEQDRRLETLLAEERRRGFDLTDAPLMRLKLIRVEENAYEFVWSRHHLILDGWSVAVVMEEVLRGYAALHQGEAPQWSAMRPYGDYVAWLGERDMNRAEAYWREALRGYAEPVRLGAERGVDAEMELGESSEEQTRLSEAVTRDLEVLSRAEQVTLGTVIAGAWGLVLSRYSGADEVVFGAAVSGRPAEMGGVERMVGLFVNTLPVRVRAEWDMRVSDWLRGVQRWQAASREYEYSPLVKVQGWSEVGRGQPLFDTLLAVENYPVETVLRQRHAGLSVSRLRAFERTNLPVTIFAVPGPEFLLRIVYDTRRFDRAAAAEMLSHLRNLIEAMTAHPDAPLATIAASVPLQTLNLVVASTFTSGSLEEALTFWLDRLRIPARTRFAPYSQVFQELLDASSLLARNREGVNLILLRIEDWVQGRAGSSADRSPQLEENVRDFMAALETFCERNSAPCVIGLCPPSDAVARDSSGAQDVRRMEMLIAQQARALSRVYVVDHVDLVHRYAVRAVNDPNADAIGHVPYTPEFFAALGAAMARTLVALAASAHKAILLDCDQTLWYGVSGEDGPENVLISSPFYALQEFMARQQQAGLSLCLCGKSDESDVFAVFRRHADMPLKLKHFTSWRINWEPASDNLRSLAAELRLPPEAFIYVSGNPIECAEVRARCPEAFVLQLPGDTATIPNYLDHAWVFDRGAL